ncbi:hypothetical protein [Ferrimicrobium sp.]|uniref:hypothetical protein n=1 Tax=Ferrimicrobium sp. TaxID=2926050 RepID=UPI00260A5DC2|nr:hypothetical protein [Ferrimicrobium sp.]
MATMILAGCGSVNSATAATTPPRATGADIAIPLEILQSSITSSGSVYLSSASSDGGNPVLLRYQGGKFARLARLPASVDLIDFLNRHDGIVAAESSGELYAVTDNGHRFRSLHNFSRQGGVVGLGFATQSHGYVVLGTPTATVVDETTDGGHTWHVIETLPVPYPNRAIFDLGRSSSSLLVENGGGGPPAYFVRKEGASSFQREERGLAVPRSPTGGLEPSSLQVVGQSTIIGFQPNPGANFAPTPPLLATTPVPSFVKRQPAWFGAERVAFDNFRRLSGGAATAVSERGIYQFSVKSGWRRSYPKVMPSAIFNAQGSLGVVGANREGQRVVMVGATRWSSPTLQRLLESPGAQVIGMTTKRSALLVAVPTSDGSLQLFALDRVGDERSIPFPVPAASAIADGAGLAIDASSKAGLGPTYLSSIATSARGTELHLDSTIPLATYPLSAQSLWIGSTGPVGVQADAGSPHSADYLAYSGNGGLSWTNVSVGANDIDAIDYATPGIVWATLSPYATPSYSFLVRVSRATGSTERVPIPSFFHQGFVAVFISSTAGWLQSTSCDSGCSAFVETTDGGVHWHLVSP